MNIYICSKCGKNVNKISDLKKIHDFRYCKNCYIARRKERRNETINFSKDKDKIMELSRQIRREEYFKYKQNKNPTEFIPEIKNKQKLRTQPKKFEPFLTLQEKQYLFGKLIKKGFSENEAKERLKKLTDFQNELRKKLIVNKITIEETKSLQTKLIEDLFK